MSMLTYEDDYGPKTTGEAVIFFIVAHSPIIIFIAFLIWCFI